MNRPIRLTVSPGEGQVLVLGDAMTTHVDAVPVGMAATAQLTGDQAARLIDALCFHTGYWPEPPGAPVGQAQALADYQARVRQLRSEATRREPVDLTTPGPWEDPCPPPTPTT